MTDDKTLKRAKLKLLWQGGALILILLGAYLFGLESMHHRRTKKKLHTTEKQAARLQKQLRVLKQENRDCKEHLRRTSLEYRPNLKTELEILQKTVKEISDRHLTGCLPRKKNCRPVLNIAMCGIWRHGHPKLYICPIIKE